MKLKILSAVALAVFLSACASPKPAFPPEELVGTWSGLLFQTEPPIRSIKLLPQHSPDRALVHWNKQTPQSIQLTRLGSSLTYSGEDLRLDIDLNDRNGKLHGVLTHELWAQSLTFMRDGDAWVSEPPKPEIIDTDYIVYLEFYLDETGKLQARIQSNKENRELHFTINHVEVSGNEILFDISNERFSIVAEFISADARLFLDYGNAGGKRRIELTRLDPSELEGYLPRAPGEIYEYKMPRPEPGSWETASLDEAGVNTSITGLIEAMNSGDYNHIHSVIVVKDGKLVFEEYFHGYQRESLHDVRSAFKSIAALLLGKAIGTDKGISVDTPILDFYPLYDKDHSDKRAITIEHALTMTTGIEREDEDAMQWRNDDWVKYKLNLPLVNHPGERFEYSSGGAQLLSGIIEHATGQYLPLYLQQQFLLLMGIERFQMLTSPAGRGYLAGNFHLRAIDLARFGQIILDKGRWRGTQVIDEAWITEVMKSRVEPSWPEDASYGYLWRILDRQVEGRTLRTIEAWGNGGQFLIVVPELDAVIVFTGGNYNLFPEMEEKPFTLLHQYVLPALIHQYPAE